MNPYRTYMQRVALPEAAHSRIMEALARRRGRRPLARALAACCALALITAGGLALLRGGWAGPLLESLPRATQTGEALPPVTGAPPSATLDQEHTLVVEDPFEGQPHGFFNVEGVDYTDCTGADQITAEPAPLPQGWFQESMTAQQIITALGGEDEVPWSLLWAGFGLDGTAWYDGQGQVWQAVITGVQGEDTLTLILAPGRMPTASSIYPDAVAASYNGVEVTAYFLERQEEGGTVYEYHADYMRGGTGVRFTFTSPRQDTAAWITNVLVRYSAGMQLMTTSHLVPASIPAWRSESLTLEQARAEDLGAYLPQNPEGFSFESAWRELGQGRDWLRATWVRGMDSCSVTVSRPEEAPACMDPGDRAWYDINLYTIPWAESVPDAIMFGGFQDPVFRVEDLTEEVVAARARWEDQDSGDTDGWRYSQFGVWYGEAGVLVEYAPRGIDPADLFALIVR